MNTKGTIIQLPYKAHIGLSGIAAIASATRGVSSILDLKGATTDCFIKDFNKPYVDLYLPFFCARDTINEQLDFAKCFSNNSESISSAISAFKKAVKSIKISSNKYLPEIETGIFTIDSLTKNSHTKIDFKIEELFESKRKYNNFLKEKL